MRPPRELLELRLVSSRAAPSERAQAQPKAAEAAAAAAAKQQQQKQKQLATRPMRSLASMQRLKLQDVAPLVSSHRVA